MHPRRAIRQAIVFLGCASIPWFASRAAEIPAFTDPDQAGAGFQVQGEYRGTVGGTIPIGIQIMDMGQGKLEGLLYPGGLPGAGWENGEVFHLRGILQGKEAVFTGVHGERLMFENSLLRGTVSAGVIRGEARMFLNQTDNARFQLDKVQRQSSTLGAKPPTGAVVLFDGSHTDHWVNGTLLADGLLAVGTRSKLDFGSARIHIEFQCPHMPRGRGMQRGNSGVYIKHEWEIQIVDSFGWHHENRKFERLSRFGRCGGIHEMVAPRINMSFPPLSWQTYDIEYHLATIDDEGKTISPEWMSVRHNGVLIHDRFVLPPAPPGRAANTSKAGKPGPLFLQDHGNPVRFRNIWVLPLPTTAR